MTDVQIKRVEELLRRAAKVVETSPETPLFAAELMAQADELAALTKPPALPKEGEEAAWHFSADVDRIIDQALALASQADTGRRDWQAAYHAVMLTQLALSSLPVRSGEVERLREENERLSKAVCGGILGDLLTEDESAALADFVKGLRAAALATPQQVKEGGGRHG